MRPVKMALELKRGIYNASSKAASKHTDDLYDKIAKITSNGGYNDVSFGESYANICKRSRKQECEIVPKSGDVIGTRCTLLQNTPKKAKTCKITDPDNYHYDFASGESESDHNQEATGRMLHDNRWNENTSPVIENDPAIQFQNMTADYEVQTRELQDTRDEKELAQQEFIKELNKVNQTVHELKTKCIQLETSKREAIDAKILAEEKSNYYQTKLDETKNSNATLTDKCLQLEKSPAEIKQKYGTDMEQFSTPVKQGSNQKAEDKLNIDYGNQIAEMMQDLLARKKELAESKHQILDYEQKCQNYERNIEKQSAEIQSYLQQIAKKEAFISQTQQLLDQQKSQHSDDLKKADNSCSNLSNENNLLKKQISQHLDEVKKLQNDMKEAENSFCKLSEENTLLKEQISQHLDEARNSLSNQGNEITMLKKQNASLTNRLATEMSTKISVDERSLENVSVKNRPMNIASEYEIICSNEWHDAKGAVDEKCDGISEDDKIKFLRSIFELSENEVTCQFEKIIAKYQNLISQPFEDSSSASTTTAKSIPDGTKVVISDDLRNNADSVNIAAIVQKVQNQTAVDYQHLPSAILTESNVVKFMEASVQLAWKMVLQRPSMHFTQDGLGKSWQGETKQEPFWSSSNPSDPQSKVKYYVHPALYHGESMMVKGRVYLSKT